MRCLPIVMLAALLLPGCTYTPAVDLTPSQYMSIMNPKPLPDSPLERPVGAVLDPAYPRPGYTYASGEPDGPHGVQVFYVTADGDSFLWYPGNRRVVHGEYRLIGNAPEGLLPKRGRVDGIKFKYQPNSYNPVTGRRGGTWDRRDRMEGARSVISYARGDIFDLSSGSVPYPRLKCDLPAPMEIRPSLFTTYCETPGQDRAPDAARPAGSGDPARFPARLRETRI